MYQKKCSVEESFDLLLIGVEGTKKMRSYQMF